MKRKMLVLILTLICVLIVFILFIFLKGKNEIIPNISTEAKREISAGKVDDSMKSMEGEVICSVETKEEAERVASEIDGKLKSYSDKIAVISVNRAAQDVINENEGREDLPPLYLNHIYHTNSTQSNIQDMAR